MNEKTITYDIYGNRENGSVNLLATGLTKAEAIAMASGFAKSRTGITVEWMRSEDGQQGYLNQDGRHAIAGIYWT